MKREWIENEKFMETFHQLQMKNDDKIKLLLAMLEESQEKFGGCGSYNEVSGFIEQKIEIYVFDYMKKQAITKERQQVFNEIVSFLSENFLDKVSIIGVATAEVITKNGILNVKVSKTEQSHEEKQKEAEGKKKERYPKHGIR